MTVGFNTNAHDADGDTLTYTWNFGDGKPAVKGARTVDHKYARVGRYTVSVTVSDGKLEASDSLDINVLEPHYYGEWFWTAAFGNDTFFDGYFSVAISVPDQADSTSSLKDASGGLWTLCQDDSTECDAAVGAGIIGTFSSGAQSELGVVFVDSNDEVKLVTADSDGKLGTEVAGKPTFSGTGEWYLYSDEAEPIGFAMTKVDSQPAFQPQSLELSQVVAAVGQSVHVQAQEGLQSRALNRLLSKVGKN